MSQFKKAGIKKAGTFQGELEGNPLNDVQPPDSITEQETTPMSVPVPATNPQPNIARSQSSTNLQWELIQLQKRSNTQWNAVQSQQISIIEQETAQLPVPIIEQETARLPVPIIEQETARLPVPTIHRETASLPAASVLNVFYRISPKPLQPFLLFVFDRARDQEPEAYVANAQNTATRWVATWGWLSTLMLVSACGIALIAYAFADSRVGGDNVRFFLYPGLLLIFMPTALRLLSPIASRAERVGLLCSVGINCYLIKVMSSPLYFSFFDEFLHWRTANDITMTKHLFTSNVILPISPYYSGLEIVTNAFSTLSGLNNFISGLIVIGIARLLMLLVLFMLNEKLLMSARMASIATLLYMVNPHFIFFDSQFAYESLSIPLAALVLLVVATSQSTSHRILHLKSTIPWVMFVGTNSKKLSRNLFWLILIGCLVLVALTFVHHVTDFFLDGILIIWVIAYASQHFVPLYRSNLVKIVLLGVLMSVAWANFHGNPVAVYLFSFLGNAINDLKNILAGLSDSRQLFVTYGGPQTFLWERLLAALAVVLILLSLPFGLFCLWQRYRSNALACTFGILSLLYPLSQVFRFTNIGSNLTDRAAAFLFIPVTTVLAIFITHFWPVGRMKRKHLSFIASAMSVMFLGGFIVGAGAGLTALPGPYLIVDPRSVEPEGIQTAIWSHSYLGSNNRIGTDRTNQVLMATYGDQHSVTSIADHVDVAPIFFATRLGNQELALLKKGRVHYLVVDMRLSQALPVNGFYFVEGEVGGFHHTTPIAVEALTKFNAMPRVNKVFDSGDIVIYDTGGLIH